MADDPPWNRQPALGSVIVRMAELYMRALRVDLERRRQNLERMARLVARK